MITFLSKWHDIFSCLFQYSEIAISSTETNDTSYESPGLQLLDSGRSIASNIMGMPLPLAVISIFCQIAIFSNFGPMVQSSRPLWKVTWNFLWIFDFGPMVQSSSPLQDVSWNNLKFLNFGPMVQRSSSTIVYNFWFSIWLSIEFLFMVLIRQVLKRQKMSRQVLRRQNPFYVLPGLTSIPKYMGCDLKIMKTGSNN